ncbi:hypothetical protein [Streptomyces sp. SP18CS02]|uniref:hypothetical protein n=1 Tax=Streptomyces sp. SP18CS02 TaxID=3002531 RepID=UPI002E774E1D|nr:hypothetical protein [Streptomyces sp. SP18CS02]MEE1751205.1 hypothetical protein [Streptomyces sp. SP18CS02]
MSNARRATAIAVGATVLLGLGALPAHAENYRDTNFSGWTRGTESSRWHDNDRDNTTTALTFADCYTDAGFSYATLKVWRDVPLSPDVDRGTRTNYCGTSLWGKEAQGDYYFELDGFLSGSVMTVKSIRIKW